MKKTALFISMALSAFTATAGDLVMGVSHLSVSESQDGIDVDLSGLMASIGYKVALSDSFYLIPEIGAGVGLGDDTVEYQGYNVDVELDSFLVLSLKAQIEFDSGFYIFAAPSYVDAEFTGGTVGYSATYNTSEMGVSAGLGYSFTDNFSTDITFDSFDETDVMRLGLKITF